MPKMIPLPNGTLVYVSSNIDVATMAVPGADDATWVEVKKVTDTGFAPSGGEEAWATFKPLGADVDTVRPAGRTPQQAGLQFQDDPDSTHAQLISNARDTKRLLAWMLRLPNGARITFPGYATGGYFPTTSKNQLMVVDFTIGLTAMPKRLSA